MILLKDLYSLISSDAEIITGNNNSRYKHSVKLEDEEKYMNQKVRWIEAEPANGYAVLVVEVEPLDE